MTCPSGKKVLGGGVTFFNEDILVTSATPSTAERYSVYVQTYSGKGVVADGAVNVRVTCAYVD